MVRPKIAAHITFAISLCLACGFHNKARMAISLLLSTIAVNDLAAGFTSTTFYRNSVQVSINHVLKQPCQSYCHTTFFAQTRSDFQASTPASQLPLCSEAQKPALLKASNPKRRVSTKNESPVEVEVRTPKKTPSNAKTKLTKPIKTKSSGPTHWTIDSDEIDFQRLPTSQSALDGSITTLDVSDGATGPLQLRFTVRGNPLPLRRHRTSRGFVYNPSARAQQSFRESVENIVFPLVFDDWEGVAAPKDDDIVGNYSSQSELRSPLWGPEQPLAVAIVFRMKRPKSHFIAGKPGPDRLRATAPKQTSSTLRTDVDNLAKFVLDSLNGVLYADDRQIASLHVTKLYDNDVNELCQGSTCVCIRLLRDDDLPRLLSASLYML